MIHINDDGKEGHVIYDSSSEFEKRPVLRIIGATIADDDVNEETIVTISPAGGGHDIYDNGVLMPTEPGLNIIGATIIDTPGKTQITIPTATPQIQSDWNQTNNTLLDYIKNKPSIPANSISTTDYTHVFLLGGM